MAWLGFFGLLRLGWVETHLVGPYTELQAAGAWLLFGPPARPISVGLECSGTDVLALCLGAILAYPSPWRRRLGGLGGGLALVLGLNVVRIGTLGLASANPSLFYILHVYVWPGLLGLAVAAYVFWWMRAGERPHGHRDRQARELVSVPRIPTRFVALASVCLVAFYAASPVFFESAALLRVATFVAGAAASFLRAIGVDASASATLLQVPRGSVVVTQECLSTPIIPIYVAAVITWAATWPRRVIGLALVPPLFVLLGIARLLVVALPASDLASPLFLVHAFFQLILGVVLVTMAAVWRSGASPATVGRAVLGSAGGAACAWAFASTPLAQWLAAWAPVPDAQGAVAFAPIYQAGLYSGIWIAAGEPAQWRRAAAGAALLVVLQVVFLGSLHVLGQQGLALGVPGVRGWAVAAPLAILFVAVWRAAGPPTRAGDAGYRAFWGGVGATFPDLGGAESTRVYREHEMRLIAAEFGDLRGRRVLKSDLWDEARNTRILQWMERQGAIVTGIDISAPVVALATREFGGRPLRAANADVRALPFADGTFDAIYSMGTVEHFDDTDVAVRELFRVLRPGGVALVGVPNRHDPFLRPLLVELLWRLGLYGYGFEKSYSRRGLRDLLQSSGFVVRDAGAILFIPGWMRMLDLLCHTRYPALEPLVVPWVRLFAWIDARVPPLRRHGCLVVARGERPPAAGVSGPQARTGGRCARALSRSSRR